MSGRVVRNPLFGWLAVPALVVGLTVVAGYNAFFTRLLTAENWIKAWFVAVVNPVIFEVIVVWCRVLARSHRHNHPLTGVMTVAIAMTLKKMYGRYVAATITKTSYVTMCSVFLGLMEYLSVTTVPRRDRFFYKRCGSLGRACCGLSDAVDTTAQMKNPRNSELRVHSAVMETSLEIVFTWTGVILVLWYNVSADGTPVDTMTVIANGAVQHGIEMLVDLIVILHLTVLQGEPYLEYANSRFAGWPFATGMLTFFASVRARPIASRRSCLPRMSAHRVAICMWCCRATAYRLRCRAYSADFRGITSRTGSTATAHLTPLCGPTTAPQPSCRREIWNACRCSMDGWFAIGENAGSMGCPLQCVRDSVWTHAPLSRSRRNCPGGARRRAARGGQRARPQTHRARPLEVACVVCDVCVSARRAARVRCEF